MDLEDLTLSVKWCKYVAPEAVIYGSSRALFFSTQDLEDNTTSGMLFCVHVLLFMCFRHVFSAENGAFRACRSSEKIWFLSSWSLPEIFSDG